MTDYLNFKIRQITPDAVVTTLAGGRHKGSDDGMGADARFSGPTGVAIDTAGNLYVTDTPNNLLRKVTPAGSVTTLAGVPGVSGFVDGTGSAVRFALPGGVGVDAQGNVYVADSANNSLRKAAMGINK